MTSLRKTPTIPAAGHKVILCKKTSDLRSLGFTPEEYSYIKEAIKEDRKLVILNQLKKIVFVQFIPDDLKEAFKTFEAARKAGANLIGYCNEYKITDIYINSVDNDANVSAFAEGMALANYQFLKYKKEADKEANKLKTIYILGKYISEKDIEQLQNVIDATIIARDLVNEPVNFLTAEQLSKEFVKLGKKSGFSVEVFHKSKIEALKMGGLIAVNKGSVDPPTFTIMEYKPKNAKNKKPIVLIGKGVVYDTGGLSLKPTPNSMDSMKCDMAGGAAVGATMYAVAKSKLPVHIIALVPATDNRPGGNAYVPGDVITMYSGTTVEMLNADAEGRMILADALHYAKKFQPGLVIDLATLTGAAVAAIGNFGIVSMGTADEKVKNKLNESGNAVYERLAEMPFWDEYDELIKSDVAEIKNIGGPHGGAITAGKFLARFIDYPWMHFDIAGPAFLNAKDGYRVKGGTGIGVRLLFDFLKNF
jgi:leucyl aminopeptidase